MLEAYYRGCGWRVSRGDDGTVRAAGLGGVTDRRYVEVYAAAA